MRITTSRLVAADRQRRKRVIDITAAVNDNEMFPSGNAGWQEVFPARNLS